MEYDYLAKQCAKEALTTVKPGRFKVTFNAQHRVAIVSYVLPPEDKKDTEAAMKRIFVFNDGQSLLFKKWIHHVGWARVTRSRGPRANVDVFAAGPSQRALICEVYTKAMEKALKQ